MLPAYAEGYEILHAPRIQTPAGPDRQAMNHGSVVRSWLNRAGGARVLHRDDQLAASRGYVEDSGEGRWTVEEAMRWTWRRRSSRCPARAIPPRAQQESFGAKVIAALRHEFGGHAVKSK